MMITKQEILKTFQKESEKHWKVKIFEDEGFVRKNCNSCKKGFWTLDLGRKHCPDPACGEEYNFIENPITKKSWDYMETWKLFEKFFVRNNHSSISRYPVVSRWRNDLFFNIASIVDFQRFDNGVMSFDYPANPLIVPQMCLRFSDIQNVGITGRHHTCFMMPGQHAFNPPKEGYWKDECIQLNFDFLTKEMGIPREDLIYVEDLWTMPDFSALGPYIETFSRGLELVNSGFMQFGISNNSIKELPMKSIDVGWGLDRLVWFSNGTPTGYEAVFGSVLDKVKKICEIDYDREFFFKYAKIAGSLNIEETPDLKIAREKVARQLNVDVDKLERNIAPLEAVYSICDHSRALAFAISDAALPSNVGGGYNLRVILRRALSFIKKFDWSLKLEDVAIWHADYLKKLFPELKKHEDDIVKILQVEEKRYNQMRERSRKIIDDHAGRKIPEEELMKLYESEGITPEQLSTETPPNFYQKITEKHMGHKAAEEKFPFDVGNLPATNILYYEKPPVFEFKAKVLKAFDGFVVLDQTAFYPTQGGQMHDTGYIDDARVMDVIKIGNVIIHKIEGNAKEKQNIIGKIDKTRRDKLRRHHDSIHIINGVVHKMIGPWCHQYGTEKDVDKARIDITHYEALTDEQVEEIEKMANEIIQKNLPITKTLMDRSEAENKYGFEIYTGGYVPSKQIRVVSIGNFDTEACAGTHSDSTGDIGHIAVVKTKRIADGLVRIEIKAGDVALEYLKDKERVLQEVAKKLNVNEEDVPKAVERLFETWKKKRKQLKK
ncbi:MAG: alanine--tRNA ligase [Candidatus Aenigmarchaeota archaeon]|nr:alanine--tRNA ligase [Candidatus Aenigmarchaeota archaeon]